MGYLRYTWIKKNCIRIDTKTCGYIINNKELTSSPSRLKIISPAWRVGQMLLEDTESTKGPRFDDFNVNPALPFGICRIWQFEFRPVVV